MYLHGGGDSRLSRHPGRLDRRRRSACGSSRSTAAAPRVAGARCARRATEVVELLDELAIERFGVVGWSAGGPHALALAAVGGERVTRVALVGSMPPHDGVARSAARRAPRDAARAARSQARRARARGVGQAAAAADRRPRDRRRLCARPGRVVPLGRPLARARARLPRPAVGLRARRRPRAGDALVGQARHVCPPSIADDYAAPTARPTLRLVDGTHQLLFSRWREILADVSA